MNTKTTILLCTLALLFSCEKAADKVAVDNEVSLYVHVPEELTKTWLGEEPGNSGTVPVYWTNGDVINVNGCISQTLTVADGEKLTSAQFKVRGVQPPYNIVYPAAVCGENQYSEGSIQITLSSKQEYLPNSFGNGAALTCAYAENESAPIHMKNLCSLVKISLTDDQASTIATVKIESLSQDCPISGTFELCPKTGTLTSVKGSNNIELDIKEPVQLGSKAKDFYITLPAGEYPEGFTIYIERPDRRRMICKWIRSGEGAEKGLVLSPSSMICFKNIEFVPGAKAIISESDWNEFAAAVASGQGLDDWLEKGTACIEKDIVFESAPKRIENFKYVLDGKGYSLTMNSDSPLFETLSGTVMNLTLNGALTVSEGPKKAPFVGLLAGGTIQKCTNKMAVTFNGASDVALSGLVAKADGGKVLDCVNEGNIVQTVDGTVSRYQVCCGGLVADASGSLLVQGCENKGSVKVTFDGLKRPKNGGFGGIVGRISGGNRENYVNIKSCTNSASVSLVYSENLQGGDKHNTGVGGIVGIAAAYEAAGSFIMKPSESAYGGIYSVIEDCKNQGAISNESITASDSWELRKQYTGGIVGSMIGAPDCHAVVKNCVSTGNVVPHTGGYTRAAFSSICGGIAGIAGYIEITGCTVDAKVGTVDACSFAIGGIAGLSVTKFKFDNCKVNAEINMISVKNFDVAMALTTSVLSSVGSGSSAKEPTIVPNVSGSEIRNCGFSGSINTATVSQNTSPVPANVPITNITAENFEKYILGGNYTGKDITLSGNIFGAGL